MSKQTKFAVHFELFPVTFADCSSYLVTRCHFISLMSLFQRHVARWNLPYQGLVYQDRVQRSWCPISPG